MFSYHLEVALQSLRRNFLLTVLTIAAISVGIAVSMTVFTVLRALSADPIPEKSSRLFVPLIDNWGVNAGREDALPTQLSYTDAVALMHARRGVHQSTMYAVSSSVTPGGATEKPFAVNGRAVYKDFFAMFDVPFRAGTAWRAADDEDHANVVVISSALADKLFPTGHAAGQTINLDHQDYRVVGVLGRWNPVPRFYDLTSTENEDFFLPFPTAIDRQIESAGDNACMREPAPGWLGHLSSDCTWIQFWVELPEPAAAQSYREFLYNYAAEQRRLGRYHWPPQVGLYDVHHWLTRQKVVPEEMRVATLVAFGFLLVCLLNSVALILAKFSNAASECSVRRALGASKLDIFGQCLTETALIGTIGGLLGLGMTALGLQIERSIINDELGILTRLDLGMVIITLSLAVVAAVSSGLYPAWRASNVQPASHLRAR
jgi:putative ABC transport system permease protein